VTSFFFFVSDFYEEMLALVSGLTSAEISPKMWEVLPLIYQMFQNDSFDYFTGLACR
jgi:hypothetical protein